MWSRRSAYSFCCSMRGTWRRTWRCEDQLVVGSVARQEPWCSGHGYDGSMYCQQKVIIATTLGRFRLLLYQPLFLKESTRRRQCTVYSLACQSQQGSAISTICVRRRSQTRDHQPPSRWRAEAFKTHSETNSSCPENQGRVWPVERPRRWIA